MLYDDIQLTDNDKEDNDVDGKESATSDTVAVDTVVMDTVAKDTVTKSKTTSPVDELQKKVSVTTPDYIIVHSDSDDEHDYMNWSEVKMRSNDSNNEEPQGKRRPLSNYYNVAPLPEPGIHIAEGYAQTRKILEVKSAARVLKQSGNIVR